MSRIDVAASCAAWEDAIDELPKLDLRQIGRLLLRFGAGTIVVGMLLTPPWVLIGIFTALAGALLARAPITRSPGFGIGCAFGAWLLAAVLAAQLQGIAGARLRIPGPAYQWLAVPLVGFGLAGLLARTWAWRAVTIVAVVAVVIAELQFFIGFGSGFLRIDPVDGERLHKAAGFSEHQLTFGLVCALLLLLAVQRRATLGADAAHAWLVRAVALIGLAVCGSRAAILGALTGMWGSLSARGWRWAVAGLAVIVVLGGAIALRLWSTDHARFERTLALQDGRWPIWRTAAHLISERPLVGWGGQDGFKAAYLAAFPSVNPGAVSEFPDGAGHAHNAALALAAEYGLPALLLHAALWGAVLWWLWQRRRIAPDAWRLGLGVALVALVGGLFEPYPARVMQGVAIHAALGVALALALARSGETTPA